MTLSSAASVQGHDWSSPASLQRPEVKLSSLRRAGAPSQARMFPGRIDEARGAPPVQSLALASDDPPRGNVLIVSDHAAMMLDLQRLLREGGYRVIGPASNRRDVERLTSFCRIDAAVIDLPEGGGSAAFGPEIAELLAMRGIPFVLLTGRDTVLPAPLSDRPVLAKPLDRPRLMEVVTGLLDRGDEALPVPAARVEPFRWPRVLPGL
jgi:CheY-like chemotaxis protein